MSQKVTMLPSGFVTPTTAFSSTKQRESDSPTMRDTTSSGSVMVTKGPSPVRMVTPPRSVVDSPSRGAEMATRSRLLVRARWPALMRGVLNVSRSRSFVLLASTKATLGAASSAASPMTPPPFVMARVRPSSIRWQSWGLFP